LIQQKAKGDAMIQIVDETMDVRIVAMKIFVTMTRRSARESQSLSRRQMPQRRRILDDDQSLDRRSRDRRALDKAAEAGMT
jgi:hypothetical protein